MNFRDSLKHRFGPIPETVGELINSVQLRWVGEELGFDKINLKNEKLRAYFVTEQEEYFKSDTFGKILSFVQTHPQRCKLKELSGRLILTIEAVPTVDSALEILSPLSSHKFKSASEIVSA